MNPIKQKLVSAKNKVVRNRTKILGAIAIVSTTVAIVQHRGIQDLNDFLEEKGLLEECYALTDED